MEVFIEERVFMSVIMSAAEVYKFESYGCLLGHQTEHSVLVDNALPYQSAERTFSTVDLKDKQRNRIGEILNTFPKQNIIGEFHSHPQYGNVKGDIILSSSDIKSINGNNIEIIVAINDKKRNQKWGYNQDLSISGTFAKYHIRMAAYYLKADKDNGRPNPLKRIQLWCPVVPGIKNWRQKKAS